ncbi:MAG: hypothetical protein ACW964_00160 [Candidatus Hodarchaeales archaeon]
MEDIINRKMSRLRLKIDASVNGMTEMNTRKIAFGLGVGLISISLGLIIIFFLDILFFPVKPWPYADGGSNEYIFLHKSLFWNQHIEHIQYLGPSLLGSVIWKYWIIPFMIGCSLVYYTNEFLAENRKIYNFTDKILPYSSIGVFFLNSLVYFIYTLRFQKRLSPSYGAYHILLEWFPIYFPMLVIIPTIICYLLYKTLKSSRLIYLMLFVPLALIDFCISFILLLFYL